MRVRYLVPMVPPLVILSTYGLHDLVARLQSLHSQKVRQAVTILVACSLLFLFSWNIKYIIEQFAYVRPLEYLTGKIDRDSYITIYRPEYPVMQYINSNLPEDAGILFIYIGNRGYYCDREYIFDRLKGKSTIHNLTKSALSPQDILRNFQDLGISHLLINQRLFSKDIQNGYAPAEQQRIATFFQQFTKKLSTAGNYALFELSNTTRKPHKDT